jgi:hypothetical protein
MDVKTETGRRHQEIFLAAHNWDPTLAHMSHRTMAGRSPTTAAVSTTKRLDSATLSACGKAGAAIARKH